MVFRRRDRRPIWRAVLDFLWPRGGWSRAFQYVKHRLRRLPGTPETIARGIWAGVFTAFTPFYGLHFVIAALLARVMQGNILAALLGTFFGNPLTYVPIAVVALETGNFLLGRKFTMTNEHSVWAAFAEAGRDLWWNFKAIFTDAQADWSGWAVFYEDVFYPYFVGGMVPGVIAATVCYYLAVPVIRAYQKRRRGIIAKKLAALKKKAAERADVGQKSAE